MKFTFSKQLKFFYTTCSYNTVVIIMIFSAKNFNAYVSELVFINIWFRTFMVTLENNLKERKCWFDIEFVRKCTYCLIVADAHIDLFLPFISFQLCFRLNAYVYKLFRFCGSLIVYLYLYFILLYCYIFIFYTHKFLEKQLSTHSCPRVL